ncbi:hypothetical protein SEA_FRANKIE_45 [Mycobacterium phage Frankie]|nr:hypothetical protein SEA_FRANKIE_45 [Mycobacterium phage Frankie]
MKIETAEVAGFINNMGSWKYCHIEAGSVRVTAYSDGRIEIPEVHYRDIGNLVSCLLFITQHGERLWS